MPIIPDGAVTGFPFPPWLAVAALLVAAEGTADSGRAEDPAPPAARSLLLDVARAGERLIAVGERGHILISDDEAASWRQADSPTNAMLTAVHMHDASSGWAVGHDAVILRTRDGGDHWERVHHAPEEELPLLDVWFADNLNGLAVGAYGYFLATNDGGDAWTQRAVSEDDFHLNALAPAEGGRLYIGAEAGIAYRSDDGGENWRELTTPYTGSWFGAAAPSADTVLLAGLRGHMFRSEDGGGTWTRVTTETTATLTSIRQLPSGGILVTGHDGVLLEGTDRGRSVSISRVAGRLGITGAMALRGGNLLLIGEFGVRRLSGTRKAAGG